MTLFTSKDGTTVSDATVPTLVGSLEFLGSGVSREVYALSDTEVLKVSTDPHSFAGNNRTESAAWDRIAECDRHHFAAVYAISADGSWMVSERAAGTAYDLGEDYGDDYWSTLEIAEEYGIGDMHSQNWGWRHDGSAIILDYAMGDNDYPLSCDCYDHDCGECFPNGCDCGTLDGCREQECERCTRGAVKFARVSGFGFLPSRKGSAVCSRCVPATVQPRQILGQLAGFAWIGSYRMHTAGQRNVIAHRAHWTMIHAIPR